MNDRIMNGIDSIDDSLIEEAMNYRRTRKPIYIAAGAAAAVMLIGTGFLLGTNYMQQYIASYSPPTEDGDTAQPDDSYSGGDTKYGDDGKIILSDADVSFTGTDGVDYTILYVTRDYYYTGYSDVSWDWNGGSPKVTVTMNYASDDGDTTPTETVTLSAETTDAFENVLKTYKATITAKYVKKGETEKKTEEFTRKYDKDGNSEIWFNPSVQWTATWPAKWTKGTAFPTITYKVSYSKKEIGGTEITTETTRE